MGLVDGSKTRNTQLTKNLHLEGIQVIVEYETFMPHHLVLKDGMEFLEITQGDGMGSFAHYVQDFNTKLIIVPFKKEFARKLAFLRGLKPWLQKIVYYKVNILDTCQGFMKMVECMEDKGHPCY
jgi:hypothetical protein